MGVKLQFSWLFFFIFLAFSANAKTFDVTKYGSKAVGSDISQALLSAFREACASGTPSKILIPKGNYSLGQVKLAGPCDSPIELELQGTVRAPKETKRFKGEDSWVTFQYINSFLLHGGGVFDAQGNSAWSINDCHKNQQCAKLPISLRFNFIKNSTVRDITSLDSKNFHVNVLGCRNLTFEHVKIIAPAESPNTDGIHLGRSNGVNIIDSFISTGDDCISIGDGMKNLYISKVTCGPGHGISIGSLGKYKKEDPVVGITIVNCTIQDTDNGLRIKTWPSSPGATVVSNIHFEDIIIKNVSNSIFIDQEYCPWRLCKMQYPSRVKISNVTFKNIRGTSANKEVVKLVCSKGVPCKNVEIGDINITYDGKDGPAQFQCSNVKPKISGKQNPPACTSPVASPLPK